MLLELKKKAIPVLMGIILLLTLPGCEIADANSNTNDAEMLKTAKEVSQSPDKQKKIFLGEDNNLYLKHDNKFEIIYRQYDRDRGYPDNPYSLWSSDFFRIQWSADSRYVYVIDSVYDLESARLTLLKDCLIFSWVGNKGVFLAKGAVYEGSYWDHGFYGFYAAKQVNLVEGGSIRTAKLLEDDRYYVVMEEEWDSKNGTLFKARDGAVAVKTARLRYDEKELPEKILKAYQLIREDEIAWEILSAAYHDAAEVETALNKFAALKGKYPLTLPAEPISSGHLNWDFDMRFYLQDYAEDYLL